MPSGIASRLAAACSLALIALAALALAASAALAGCGGPGEGSRLRVEPEWRLVPESTVLGKRRQFFLYGRNLDSARLSAPPSVVVEPGEAESGGRALSLYLTVRPLSPDSLSRGEAVGTREIEAKTPDTSLTFKLKVVDETAGR